MTKRYARKEYTLQDEALDILLGLHSGIPKCCVEFFVLLSRQTLLVGDVCTKVRGEWQGAPSEKPGYVACGSCYDMIQNGEVAAVNLHTCRPKSTSAICRLYCTIKEMGRSEEDPLGAVLERVYYEEGFGA